MPVIPDKQNTCSRSVHDSGVLLFMFPYQFIDNLWNRQSCGQQGQKHVLKIDIKSETGFGIKVQNI